MLVLVVAAVVTAVVAAVVTAVPPVVVALVVVSGLTSGHGVSAESAVDAPRSERRAFKTASRGLRSPTGGTTSGHLSLSRIGGWGHVPLGSTYLNPILALFNPEINAGQRQQLRFVARTAALHLG